MLRDALLGKLVLGDFGNPTRQPCLYPQLLGPKARNHVIIPQRSCLTTQPVVAQRTTGRFLTQPTQTLKGFHNSAVCRTPSAFMDNPTPNPGCAARPGALLLKSFGLGFTLKKSKGLRSKLWVKTRPGDSGYVLRKSCQKSPDFFPNLASAR